MSHVTLAQGVLRTSSMYHPHGVVVLILFDPPLCTLHRLSHLPFHSPDLHLHLPCGWFDEKSHAYFREWGVRHFGREQSSHRLWAQLHRQQPDLRDHWNLHPRVLQRHQGPRTCMTRRSVPTPSAERSLHHCSLRSEKIQRAVDKLITLLKNVCCQVSLCLSVM